MAIKMICLNRVILGLFQLKTNNFSTIQLFCKCKILEEQLFPVVISTTYFDHSAKIKMRLKNGFDCKFSELYKERRD